MIRTGIAGLGKMGLSHYAIANMHPDAEVVAAYDGNSYLTSVLSKQTGLRCYGTYEDLLRREQLDAVIISTPAKQHAWMIEAALRRGLHVFCETPFTLDAQDSERLAGLAESQRLANQVGYHSRFIGTFAEAARIARSGALGDIHHVRAEVYGPALLRPQGRTLRVSKREATGVLHDYACHAIDLIDFTLGPPVAVDNVVMRSVFSRDVEDEVRCTMTFASGGTGQLDVNWSDDRYRKMFTRISLHGSNGSVIADRQACQIELGSDRTTHYTTDLTRPVAYYLRGEEFTAQIDYFYESIKQQRVGGENSFRSALRTDEVVSMIRGAQTAVAPRRAGLFARVFS